MTRRLTEIEKWERRIKVDPNTGCHLWLRYRTPLGYGQTRVGGRSGYNILAHRLAWVRMHGGIPKGMGVLHKCDNPSCVNVEHLFIGTQADNMHDMSVKNRWGVRNLPRGKDHPRGTAKLTENQILAIREDRRHQIEIAAAYGITQSNVSRIRTKNTWSYL